MVTFCDYIYIYIMRGYLHHERHGTANIFGEARALQGQGLSALNVFVFCFLRFLFFLRSFVNKD